MLMVPVDHRFLPIVINFGRLHHRKIKGALFNSTSSRAWDRDPDRSMLSSHRDAARACVPTVMVRGGKKAVAGRRTGRIQAAGSCAAPANILYYFCTRCVPQSKPVLRPASWWAIGRVDAIDA
jgi:hypothetical protein